MSWFWVLQIAADAVLIGALAVLLLRLRRLGPLPQGLSPAKFKNFIEEAESLSKEFDRLLDEKRELINTTLASLDARISKLKNMAAEASSPPSKARPLPSAPDDMQSFRKKVRDLAGNGMRAAEIATAVGRPRGEVELVLGLSQGASGK